ncbi:MAG TPA: MMPL family transporter [Thermoanaerobaculia bacterium]|nr:MMPL family transporter [Thermoanaerobaculia bacterium]
MKISPAVPRSSRLRALFGSAFGFDRLAYFAIGHPRGTILAFAILTLLAAPGLLRLQLRTDGHALVPADDPAVRLDTEIRKHFGLRDPIVVVLQTPRPNGIFNSGTLRRVKELTAALERLDGVPAGGVTSLATEKRDRVYPGTLSFRPFLDVVPRTPEEMEIFRGDLEAIGILHGTLVSKDQSAVAILVGAPNVLDRSKAPGGVNAAAADRVALCRRIVEVSRRFEAPGNRVRVVGAPMAESLLGLHILQDLVVLLPLSIAIICLVLWLGCRRMAGVWQGMIQLAAAQAFTFGVMGWLGVPVYLTTAVLPVILTTLALADEIHLFWRYQQLLGPEPGEADRDHPEAVRTLLSQMSRPIVLATVTTIIGFLSFLSSPLTAVRSFGAFAGVGLLFCLFWSLMVGPALLALLPPASLRRPVGESAAPSERFRRLFLPLYRSPRRTLGTLALLTLLVSLGVGLLQVQDSWIGGFAPGSPFRKDTAEVNRLFNGTHLLQVELDLSRWNGKLGQVWEGTPGPLLDPGTLRAIGDFEAFLRRQPRVGGAIGPYSQLATVSFLKHARDPKRLSIPDSAEGVADLLHWFDEVRSVPRRREVIDDDRRQGVVTLFLKDPDYKQVDRLMKAARGYARAHLEPLGVRIGFAGDIAVSQAMIPAIVRTQVYSQPLSQLGCWLVVTILYRSLWVGFLIALPSSVAVAWMLGMMGWTGIPLGVATAMFCSITLGVGIDYGIHFYEVFLRLKREGAGRDSALEAAAEAGPAIVADTAAIALGFGILGISQVPSNARLGFLVAGALAVGCALTLIGLGTLLDRSVRDREISSGRAGRDHEIAV